MSDKDCVSREAVYRLADDLWHLMFNLEEDGDCIDMDEVAGKIHELAKLSPVEQPMSAVEYDRKRRRMCKQYGYCSVSCPLHDFDAGCMTYEPITQEAQNIVEQWAREHPEEVNNAD